ncbi:hypothetical protein PUMCH_003875 [Australozyma saopauloensis]|uniref:tRNA ligase n=1 Tax=Australozyma saopauloensis TaxID=291208 RepID=A0AAX4HFU6_9ASCO|nr:hypothetical protein PUMCH_003875 [[Candida] saopauloensis]
MNTIDSTNEFKTLLADLELFLNTLRSSEKVVDSSVKGQRRVTHKRYKVTTLSGPVHIDNWKFPEFDFARKYDSMPCHARGLFTMPEGIVVRGYDKFFNIDELPMVKKDVLESELTGPFTAATKENGCIMFFAGLQDGTLLVCSKNLTGDLESDPSTSQRKLKHYEQGMVAIQKQLHALGKDTTDLARALYDEGLTAVAELCDDSYEEHVVAYPPEIAGFYLHGLNRNTKTFQTLQMSEVDDFAEKWGFKKVDYTTFDTFQGVMAHMTAAADSGKYNGREIEGFVIRCKRDSKDFFFKYKFEQPYYLYRQFREATFKLFADQPKRNIREVLALFPKFKRVTLAYLEFAQAYFAENPSAKDEFANNIGIIKLRKLFMESLGYREDQGIELLREDLNETLATRLELLLSSTRTVYCVSTIAFPGCGKTTTCMILANLFSNWTHIQNDNFPNAKAFYTEIINSFLENDVVFVDRMNYRLNYRHELVSSISQYRASSLPDVEIKHVGLNFMRSNDQLRALEIAKERILLRGDNHQSVKAATSEVQALALLRDTAKQFERPQLKSEEDELPVACLGSQLRGYDSAYTLLINLDVDDDHLSLVNAQIIYEQLRIHFPQLASQPVIEQSWTAAYERAMAYKPTFEKKKSLPSRKPAYYGILVERQALVSHLDNVLSESPTWQAICQKNRVQAQFHITLAHEFSLKGSPENREIWTSLGRFFEIAKTKKTARPGERTPIKMFADLKIEKIVVIENTLIALKASPIKYYKPEEGELVPVPHLLPYTNKHLHITIGTCHPAIKPMESNTYLCQLFDEGPVRAGVRKHSNFTAHVYDWDEIMEKQQCFIFFQ